MRKKVVTLLLLILSTLVFAKYTPQQVNKDIEVLFNIVPRYEKVEIKGKFYNLDMRKLMQVTAMVESSYATGRYSNRIPKTYMQMEKQTALYSLSQGKNIREKIEKELGRKLKHDRDKDAMFVAYIIYINRLRYNKKWLELHTKYFTKEDAEWYMYKVFFNSIKGSATYDLWTRKQRQLKHLVR